MKARQAWAGIDAGKEHHHVWVMDDQGQRLLSRRVANDELELTNVISDVAKLADQVTWAVDLVDGPAALVITILVGQGHTIRYISGVSVNRAAATYGGEGKTDAQDAAIIADQARMRKDLRELHLSDEVIVELQMLTAHRTDLVTDRTRSINRLRDRLMGVFPALERELDFTNQGPLVLVGGYQTADALRSLGAARLERWLRARKVRGANALAAKAVAAAGRQRVHFAGQDVAALLIARLAAAIQNLDRQIAEVDHDIQERFDRHQDAKIITSMPGIGTLLGAEFLAATGGDMTAFASADQLAGYAGLAPMPRDSGKRTGNLHRPKRYNRQLQRVFYTSALISIQRSPASRTFYDRKRTEGNRHGQAVLALARRRVNVIWALLRDHRPYEQIPTKIPAAAA